MHPLSNNETIIFLNNIQVAQRQLRFHLMLTFKNYRPFRPVLITENEQHFVRKNLFLPG
jgi:hypothetical protein